jgi:hypothetical protein
LAGWLFTFSTSERLAFRYGIASLAAGVAVFFAWDRVAAKHRLADHIRLASPSVQNDRNSSSLPTDSFPS